MTKAVTDLCCGDPLSCAGEGQAAPDAILFLEPRNHARRCRADVFAAAMLEADPEFYRDQIEAIGQLLFRDGNEAREVGIQD